MGKPKLRCNKCKGSKAVRDSYLIERNWAGTETRGWNKWPCDHCQGTGIEPKPSKGEKP